MDKLKLQSANLAGKISRPELFVPMFREILTSYSNRTFRTQTGARKVNATPSYHVPAKVIWQIERDLVSQVKVLSQQQCLDAASQLWNLPSLEEKQLAATLLGWVNADPPELVVDKFLEFHEGTSDYQLMAYLSGTGSRAIRKQSPHTWERIMEKWLESRRTRNLVSILVSVEDALEEEGEAYLPQAYEIMSRVLKSNDGAVLQELLHLLMVMNKKSASETAYFVKSLFSKPEMKNQLSERFLKRSAAIFSGEEQVEIRSLTNRDPDQ